MLQIMKGEGSCVPIKPSTHVRNAVTRPGINPNENVTAAVNIVSINNGIFNSNTAKKLMKRLMTAAKTQSREITRNRFALIFNMEESLSQKKLSAYNCDMEAGHYAAGAYFTLIFVLVFFIALTFILIYFLSRELNRSLRRVKESNNFSRAVLLAQEKERSRLSRELHDTIAQDLRYLSLEMNKIAGTQETAEREKLCANASAFHSDLIRKVRDICDYLVPPDFRFQGLPDALRNLCLAFGNRTGIDCRIDITGDLQPDIYNEEKQLQIYRIIQEALMNVEKHAQASEAIVVLRCDPKGSISIGISDDGKGFSLNAEQKEKGLGIKGMKERAALLGGSLEIKSEAGEGTLVRFQMINTETKEGSDECLID